MSALFCFRKLLNMMDPDHIENFEGIIILSIVIACSLFALFVAFVFAYVFKWERLMTEIKIQRENALRTKLQKHETAIDLSNNTEVKIED